MKKIIHVLLCIWAITISKTTFSQGYTPFPEDSASWAVHDWFANTSIPGNTYYYYNYLRYYTHGDTVISGTTYNILQGDTKAYIDTTINGPMLGTTVSTHDILYYRNDAINKRVYKIFADTGTTEFLWYDFNIQLGDTLFPGQPNQMVIDSIDQVFICGQNRNRYFYTEYWTNVNNCLVEGIGNMSNFELNKNNFGEHAATSLVCFVDFSTCGTSMGLDYCNIELGLNEQNQPHWMQVHPNPAVQNIYLDETLDIIYLYDLMGKMALQTTYTNQVDVSNLHGGVYILMAEKNGEKYYSRIIKQE
jgi:hypothetical protein